jgi:flagellar capping protein FliD
MQVSKKDEELTELRMKLEVLQGERQTSEDELNNKLELMKKLNTELSTFKERVTNLAKENEVLEVKVWNVHLCMCPVSLTSY